MARLLALNWNDQELRAVVGAARGGRLTVEQFITAPLTPEGDLGSVKLTEQIRTILSNHRVAKVDTIVAIGRVGVEMKNLTLPPAPDEELPELVRFQAMRELGTVTEDSAIDFTPTTFDLNQPRGVLAAALSGAAFKRIEQVCEAAALDLKRIVLAPCAAAALVRPHLAEQTDAVLAVDLAGEVANLIVVAGETVVFVRSSRIAGQPQCLERTKQLLAEIRRTIGAVQNAAGQEGVAATRVSKIVVLAEPVEQATLTTEIEQALGLHTVSLNLLATVDLASSAVAPRDVHRYAALIGVLLDEVANRRPQMDFLHPREKPAPVSRRRPLILAGAGVGGLLLLAALWGWWTFSSLDAEIARLTKESTGMDPAVKQAGLVEKKVAALDAWSAGDITWLDELSEISRKMPDAQQAMLTVLRVAATDNGGDIQLEGLAQSAGVIEPLEKNLRDERHAVEGKGAQQDQRRKKYGWRFKAAVAVASPADTKKPATPAAPKVGTATKSDASTKPNAATKVAEPTKTADPAKAGDTAQPSGTAQPSETNKPAEAAKPADASTMGGS